MKNVSNFFSLALIILMAGLSSSFTGCDRDTQAENDVKPAGFSADKENFQTNGFSISKDKVLIGGIMKNQINDISIDTYVFAMDGHDLQLDKADTTNIYGQSNIDAGKIWCKKDGTLERREMLHGGNGGKENIKRFGRKLIITKYDFRKADGKLYTSIAINTVIFEPNHYYVYNVYFRPTPDGRVQKELDETNLTAYPLQR